MRARSPERGKPDSGEKEKRRAAHRGATHPLIQRTLDPELTATKEKPLMPARRRRCLAAQLDAEERRRRGATSSWLPRIIAGYDVVVWL